MNYEAIGYLNMMAKQDQTLLATAEFRGLRGAAKAMAGRYKDAVAEFSAPALAMDPSSSLWRGYLDVKTGDFAGARHEFAAGRKVASQFDPTWRARFAVADAEAALAQGDVASARHEVMVAAAEKLGAVDQDKLRFLQARVDEASGHADLALAGYDAASHSSYGGVAAPALLRATQIRMTKGQERLPDAIAAHNSPPHLWRGPAPAPAPGRASLLLELDGLVLEVNMGYKWRKVNSPHASDHGTTKADLKNGNIADTINPPANPAGAPAAAVPAVAKLPVVFLKIGLLKTLVFEPGSGKFGILHTGMPPVLFVATLSKTSAFVVFSISIPATLNSAREFLTTT